MATLKIDNKEVKSLSIGGKNITKFSVEGKEFTFRPPEFWPQDIGTATGFGFVYANYDNFLTYSRNSNVVQWYPVDDSGQPVGNTLVEPKWNFPDYVGYAIEFDLWVSDGNYSQPNTRILLDLSITESNKKVFWKNGSDQYSYYFDNNIHSSVWSIVINKDSTAGWTKKAVFKNLRLVKV